MKEIKVFYQLSMVLPRTHNIHVKMAIPAAPADEIELKMPTWLPGAYKLNDFAKNVESFRAQTAQEISLSWKKTDKQTWLVHCRAGDEVYIHYDVYAFMLEDDSSYLSEKFGIINPGTVCLAVKPYLNEACSLEVILPESWHKISTGLEKTDQHGNHYSAQDYHELMDCPLMVGNHRTEYFDVEGITHEVAIEGQGNINVEKFVADLEKISRVEFQMMTHVPFRRYVYQLLITEKDAGLEHRNSTLIFVKRFDFEKSKYNDTLTIFSHELFHAWNVKALKPRELVAPDYFTETYTDLLWVSEGFTNYYHLQFLLRAGILTVKEYLEEVAKTITRYRKTPGHRYQSASEASYDAWIKYYRWNENTDNSAISYYLKGSLIALFLDVIIMKETDGKNRMDDLIRGLYFDHYVNQYDGFTYDDVVSLASSLAGKNLSGFFKSTVNGRTDLPFEDYFQMLGLTLKAKETVNEPKKGYLGIRIYNAEGSLWVRVVDRESPAQRGGLQPKDEILAVDLIRVTSKSEFDSRLGEMEPGRTLEFTISRQGEIQTILVQLGDHIPEKLTLESDPNASEEARKLFRIWTGHEFQSIQSPKATESTQTECVSAN